jgi:AraC-like DNA-binding protein
MRAIVHYTLARDCPAVELIAAEYQTQRFSPHWHAGFAIGVVTRGAQRFRTWGRNWVVSPGDLILLNPGQVHDGSAIDAAGWASRMAYVPAATFTAIARAGRAHRTAGTRFVRPVVRSPRLAALFSDWHLHMESEPAGVGQPTTVEVLAAVASLLGEVPRNATAGSTMLDLALERCERLQHLAQHDPRDDMNALWSPSNASLSTVWRRTRTRFDIGPRALKTHLRLVWAKQQLARGTPILESALEAGFHDQAHFTRQFTAAYGMTPAQFRSRHAMAR